MCIYIVILVLLFIINFPLAAQLADMIRKSLNGKRYFIADRFHVRVGTFIKMQCFVNEALPSEFETIYGEADYRQMPSGLLGFCLNLKTLEDSKNVAEDVKSFATHDPDEQRLHVFCFSEFFKYEGEISVKKLMRLWIDRDTALVQFSSSPYKLTFFSHKL